MLGAIVLCLFTYRQLHLEQPFLELRVFLNQKSLLLQMPFLSGVTNMAMIGAEMVFTFVYPKYSWRICLPFRVNAFTRSVSYGTYDASNGSHFLIKLVPVVLRLLGCLFLTVATLPFAFLTKSNTYYLYHCPICDSDVWYFDGHDACDNFWHECFYQ